MKTKNTVDIIFRMNNQECEDCIAHVVQWSDMADENERLKIALRNVERTSTRLRRKINRLHRRIEMAEQLIEQQDVLLTALVRF